MTFAILTYMTIGAFIGALLCKGCAPTEEPKIFIANMFLWPFVVLALIGVVLLAEAGAREATNNLGQYSKRGRA